MFKKALALLLFAFLFSFGSKITITSNILEKDNDIIKAKGNVLIFYKDYIIQSEKAIYYPNTKDLYLIKNVIFKDILGKEEIHAKKAFINFKTDKGYFVDGYGRFINIYFVASKVIKDKEKYYVSKGQISTCKPYENGKLDNDLRICFNRATIDSKYVFSFGDSLKYKKAPLLYTPIGIFPIGKRRSGFLVPLIGSNTYNSFIYQQQFFLAISRSKDATFGVDIRSSQASGINLEYRQDFSQKSFIRLYGAYYKEPTPPKTWWEGRDLSTFRENRYQIGIKGHKFRFDFGINLISDPYFLQDIYLKTNQRTVPFLTSYLNFKKDTKNYYFYFSLSHFYDTTSINNYQTLQRLPEIDLYLKDRPLKYGIFYNLDSSLDYFYRTKGLKSIRTYIKPTLYKAFNIGDFTFLNEIGFKELNYFDTNISSYKKYAFEPFYKNSFSLGKFYKFNKLGFDTTYELSYDFEPTNNQNTPFFDNKDLALKTNLLAFKLNNVFSYDNNPFASIYLEDGYSFLNGYIYSTSYSTPIIPISSNYIEPNIFYIPNKKITPLHAIFSLYPFRFLNYSTDLYYDPSYSSFSSVVQNIGFNFKKLSLFGSYISSQNSQKIITSNQITYGFNYFFSKHAKLFFSDTHDNITHHELYKTINFSYLGPCWSIGLTYQSYYDGTRNTYISEYLLTLNIFNLQSFVFPLKK